MTRGKGTESVRMDVGLTDAMLSIYSGFGGLIFVFGLVDIFYRRMGVAWCTTYFVEYYGRLILGLSQ
jgi:hypothetical protein